MATLKQRLIDLTTTLTSKLNTLFQDKEDKANKKQNLASLLEKDYPSVPAVNAGISNATSTITSYVNQQIGNLVEPIPLIQKGEALGVAETDGNNIILAKHLPSTTDQIINLVGIVTTTPTSGMSVGQIRYNSVTKKIITSTSATASVVSNPVSNAIYVDTSDNKTYRWSGLGMILLSSGLVLGVTSESAYRGDRGLIAYEHTLDMNNPHNVTKTQVGLGNVDNTSDLAKPLSTAAINALALKENYLGVPATNGRILSSTIAGARTWIPIPTGVNTFDALTDKASATLPTTNIPLKDALASKASVSSVAAINTYLTTYVNENLETEFPDYALQLTTGLNF